MGGNGFWDFGSLEDGGWGDQRLLSNLRAWLTQNFAVASLASSSSPLVQPMYQGWHDWHIDGTASNGRFHKFFLMVNKSTAEGHTELTNVKLVPADVLYAHTCTWEEHAREAGKTKGMLLNPLSELSREKMVAWGIRDDWHAYEKLGCDIPMDPGDMLFFREDVWHRTQDMRLDRVALIMDVFRAPLTDVTKINKKFQRLDDRP